MSSKSTESEELFDNFIDELWLEKGLSQNTLSAYRQDISTFNKLLALALVTLKSLGKLGATLLISDFA